MGRTLALALLLALAAGSQAARFPTYGAIDAEELPKSLVDWQSSDLAKDAPVDNALLGSALYNDLEALADDPALNKHRDFPIHIATKFLVKPGECCGWKLPRCVIPPVSLLHSGARLHHEAIEQWFSCVMLHVLSVAVWYPTLSIVARVSCILCSLHVVCTA